MAPISLVERKRAAAGEQTYAAAVATEVRVQMARTRVSQVELAAALGVSQMWVSRRLNGRTPFDIEELAAIADLLGCDVRELLPGHFDGEPVNSVRGRSGLPRLDSNQQPFGYPFRRDAGAAA